MTGDAPDFLWQWDTAWAWNGEKLAFAARGREIEMTESLEFAVQVFENGEAVYYGIVGSSLGTVYGPEEPSPVTDPNHLILTWN